MGDLGSALNTAFDEVLATPESTATPETPANEPEPEPQAEPETEEAPSEAAAAPQEEEPTGDVLLDKLTPDQIAELKKDPRLKAIYKGLMSSYTPKMQQLAEQAKLWDALNNPQTQKQAIEALARTVGLDIAPTDKPQREQAASVADSISEEWSKVVGPEAAQMLRPLIEKTALAAVNGTLQPLQQATQYLQLDARARQAQAQVAQFKAMAAEKGWELTPEVEAKMSELGQQIRPMKDIESVQDGVAHLERLYHLATVDKVEATVEKRLLERMKKNRETAEPARGVPSAGREKRSNVGNAKNLSEALDIAMEETAAEFNLKR